MIEIDQERAEDATDVEALYDLAFAPGRAALSSYRLRAGARPVSALCMTARDEYQVLVGAIRYWPIRIGAARSLLLGPVAVHPIRQGEGVGGRLIATSLGVADAIGWERALLVGDEPFYRRFGFFRLDGVEMPPPTNPARVLGRALRPGAWDGVRGPAEAWSAAPLNGGSGGRP